MKKWIVIAGLFCLTAGAASADVSHEIIVGLEGDSTDEVESSLGGVSVDLSDKVKESNSQFILQYSHFFKPLKEDEKNIELRRFYQHPSNVFVGLVSVGSKSEDTRIKLDSKVEANMLALGGEYFFPTDTGIFLTIGSGLGTFKQTVNGVASPDADVKVVMSSIGVRQYVAPMVELHLAFNGDSMEAKQAGQPTRKNKENVTVLGVEGVIKDTVGISLEIGDGEREDDNGTTIDKFDVGQINFGVAVYVGAHFSLALDVEAEAAKQTSALPAGVSEYVESTARSSLTATYWFNERFGMQLPVYAVSTENKTVTPLGDLKDTTDSSGFGLYAAFRF